MFSNYTNFYIGNLSLLWKSLKPCLKLVKKNNHVHSQNGSNKDDLNFYTQRTFWKKMFAVASKFINFCHS